MRVVFFDKKTLKAAFFSLLRQNDKAKIMPMTVYVEYVFLSNFSVNFMLLYFTVKICKTDLKKLRLFFADLLGSFVAIVLPLFSPGFVFSTLTKLFLSLGIVGILAKYKSKGQFFKNLLVFWALTFLFGGVLFGFYYVTKTDFSVQEDLSIISASAFPLILAGGLFFCLLVKNLVCYLNAKKNDVGFTFDVRLEIGGESFLLKGFLDSGNRLTDDKTGFPVAIVLSEELKNTVKQKVAESLLYDKKIVKNAHYLSFSTVAGGVNKMFVFCPDVFEVNGKKTDAVLGVYDKKVSAKDEFDLLLNGKMDIGGGL